MRYTSTLAPLILATVLLPTSAAAERAAPDARAAPSFQRLDADRNGVIDADEVQADQRLAARFEAADLNGDGLLDRLEFATAVVRMNEETADQPT